MGSFSNDLDTTKSEYHGLVQIKEMKQIIFCLDEKLLPGHFVGNLYLQTMQVYAMSWCYNDLIFFNVLCIRAYSSPLS